MKVHEICRQQRRLLNITQAELAETIGMSQATIQHFENNRTPVSQKTLDRILEALNIKLT